MKFIVSTIIIVLLAAITVSQIAVDTFSKNSRSLIENPLEEAGDEDLDNEKEMDKVFSKMTLPKPQAKAFDLHTSAYTPSQSELIKEIIPPPPKTII